MKTILLSVLMFFLFSGVSFAQEPSDALRYSFLNGTGGTARNQALGGTGGSLGGEFSTLFINPAGLGFFKTGDFIITPNLLINSNEAQYLGKTSDASNQKAGIGASGVLFSTVYNNKKIKNVTVGIGINKTANFNNVAKFKGLNKSTSYSDRFVEEFNRDGVTDDQTAGYSYPYGSSMAFSTYLINPVFDSEGNVESFTSLAKPSYGLNQTADQFTSGGITDIAIGVGANHMNKFYFGGTLSVPTLRYQRDAFFREEDASGDPNNFFKSFQASESLETKGVGINLKLGAIYKPQSNVQFGFAYYTPTFYQLTDLYNMEITTDPEGFEGMGVSTQSSADLNDGFYLKATYNMLTPARALLSGTYFFGTGEWMDQQKGFITADLEYTNYGGAKFKDANNSEDYRAYFKELNGIIKDMYKSAINARIGGELKLNTLMLRAGGAYYGNPYSDEESSMFKVSGGLGYRNRGFYIDLSYTYAIHDTVEYPYHLEGSKVSPVNHWNNGNNIAVTLGFKLF